MAALNTVDTIRKAIEESREWAWRGWPIVFGAEDRVIANLAEVRRARQEGLQGADDALVYWQDVADSGARCAVLGEEILAAYRQKDLNRALDLVEECVQLEKQYRHDYTWGPVVRLLEEEVRFNK